MQIDLQEFFQRRKELPVVDVRSEGEFAQGHIRGAVNLPVLNDSERAQVGTDYKQKGQQEAIRTGLQLVGPRLAQLVDDAAQIANGRELLVHCWRGGMRSNNFCKFVEMMGIRTHALIGGYKAYRQQAAIAFSKKYHFILLTGYTGSGKSEVLRELKNQGAQILDLESLACHKGSAFGHLFMPPQPTSEQFQNELFEELMTLDESKPIWVEDESIAIGRIFIPADFWATMRTSPLVKLDVEKSIRIARLVNEYGRADQDEFAAIMGKIVKRLGGQHYQAALHHWQHGQAAATMEILLTYYDKAYHSSIEKRQDNVQASVAWDGADPAKAANALLHSVSHLPIYS